MSFKLPQTAQVSISVLFFNHLCRFLSFFLEGVVFFLGTAIHRIPSFPSLKQPSSPVRLKFVDTAHSSAYMNPRRLRTLCSNTKKDAVIRLQAFNHNLVAAILKYSVLGDHARGSHVLAPVFPSFQNGGW